MNGVGTRSRAQYARAVDRTQRVRDRINDGRAGRVSSIEVDPVGARNGEQQRQQYLWRGFADADSDHRWVRRWGIEATAALG